MIANSRYLHASLFSFCIHAGIFLYIYGTFDSNTTKTILISKPLQVALKFESQIPTQKKKSNLNLEETIATRSVNKNIKQVYSKPLEKLNGEDNNSLLQSDISSLLFQEVEVEISKEQQEISMYAQKIESRNKARDSKNYKEADKIRNELLDKGISIEDEDGKTTWKFK
mgnify:CR=1 FL=1